MLEEAGKVKLVDGGEVPITPAFVDVLAGYRGVDELDVGNLVK